MAPRTRSTTSSPVKPTAKPSRIAVELKHNAVKVLVAPKDISPTARILSLRHPTDGSARRFLFCSISGLFELKATTVPSSDPRSVLFCPSESTLTNESNDTISSDNSIPFKRGFVNKDAEILTATPYDLAFILLRVIAPHKNTSQKALFQPLEDLLETPESNDRSLRHILDNGHNLLKEAMTRICDTVEAGDETMYRYSEDRVLKLMLEKARCVARIGLPASLEDRFVTRVLEPPMLSVKREDTTVSVTKSQSVVTEGAASPDGSFDSQSTTTNTVVSAVFTEASSTSTVPSIHEDTVPSEVRRLQRVRTAYNFIAASCLPSFVATRLAPLLSEESSPINFQPLEEHVKHLALLRAEAAASRSMSDFSRKRGLDDDEAAEDRAEKKRRQEEEEKKKKANESRGVRDLKKVNVTGMKKMSDFFGKKPITTKAKS